MLRLPGRAADLRGIPLEYNVSGVDFEWVAAVGVHQKRAVGRGAGRATAYRPGRAGRSDDRSQAVQRAFPAGMDGCRGGARGRRAQLIQRPALGRQQLTPVDLRLFAHHRQAGGRKAAAARGRCPLLSSNRNVADGG